MNCDVGEVTEKLENEQSSFSNLSVTSPTSQFILQLFFRFSSVTSSSLNSPGEPPMFLIEWAELIIQPFRHFTYVTTHSPILPSLYLRHRSFSNPSVASPTSQFILQLIFRFFHATSSSLNSRKCLIKLISHCRHYHIQGECTSIISFACKIKNKLIRISSVLHVSFVMDGTVSG